MTRLAFKTQNPRGDDLSIVWSDEPSAILTAGDRACGYAIVGSQHLIERAERAVLLGRRYGGIVADLQQPHAAMVTLLAIFREYGPSHQPIDFAGYDDDGKPITILTDDPIEGLTIA